MRVLSNFILSMGLLALMGCSAVKTPISNQYQLSAFSTKQYSTKSRSVSLFVNAPEAVAGYDTEQMIYLKTPYLIESFAKNSWVTPPADMLYPLLVNSLQRSGYFYAIASSPSSATTDYRLDTQLFNLEQNFLQKPSFIDFSAKLILTRVSDNKVLASRIISLKIPCQTDSPYGGVVAANQAAQQFTAMTTKFVISHLS